MDVQTGTLIGLMALCLPVQSACAQEPDEPDPSAPYAEEVRFSHGPDQLAGTLFTPEGEAPHPAVVLLQGSGATDRTNFGYFPLVQPAFLDRGIAVLVYDKPGVGNSTGNWQAMTLRDRAEEAITAVEFLQTRSDISAERVGLWGISQGGWVAPLAATLSDAVAFVMTVSAPGVTPAEQNVYDVATYLQRNGYSEEDVQAGTTWARQLMQAAAEGRSYDEVQSTLLAAHRGKPWAEYFEVPDSARWSFLASVDETTEEPNVLFDPSPMFKRLSVPYLGIYGADDPLVPVPRSVEVIKGVLDAEEHSDFRIEVYDDADHGIFVEPRVFAAGYLQQMGEWAAVHVAPQ